MGRTYKDYNKELFQDHINNGQWEGLFETNSTSEKWNIFKEKFLDICNINAPIKKLKVTQNNPKWISRELYELMDQRDNAYKKAKATKSDQDFKSAKEVRNHLNRTILKAKREYLEQTLTKNTLNHRKIWKKLQEHLPGKRKNNTISKMRNHSGDITDSPKDMANLLNDHFASIGLKLANDIPKRDNTNLLPHLLGNKLQDIRHTNAREVNEIIKRFPSHKSMGLEIFNTKLIKDASPFISPILAHILNSCLMKSDIPTEWKTACITPLYKEGVKEDPNNYRPISILPFI